MQISAAKKSLEQGGVEMKRRTSADKTIVPLDEVVYRVQAELDALWDELNSSVVNIEYKE